MELSRGVGEVWYAGGSSHGVDGLRLFASPVGLDLPRAVYLQRRRGLQSSERAYKQISNQSAAQRCTEQRVAAKPARSSS